MSDIRAIETSYDGCRFRSRLEARWAVFFNAAGIEYQYEPEGFVLSDGSWYLPDFYIKTPGGDYWFAEVKGNMADKEGLRKAKLFDDHPAWEAMGCFILTEEELRVPARGWYREDGFFERNDSGWRAYVLDLDIDEYNRAAEAARTARFEHGETPAVRKEARRS